ncbi:ABC transporter ATP-binding protein [Paenibacillus hodogayensis]|uniref:ABC transporter ATP-binding protein n=1 Tax=Paenibacillus hodogayensis TaxID=279208 RepID=A0ABV5W124_9BACL
MIVLDNIVKSYALQGQSLPILRIRQWKVESGQRIALMGPSGSGKSTLLHLIGGVLKADSGELRVGSFELHRMREPARDSFRAANIGYMFQDFHLIPSLSARQNVELVMDRKLARRERQDRIEHWFERVGLTERMNHLPSQLSRGQQQRVAMIRALVNRPPLVLADEPTGSLDRVTAEKVMALLLQLCGEEKLTLLTVTHDDQLAGMYPTRVQMSEINELMAERTGGDAMAIRAGGAL